MGRCLMPSPGLRTDPSPTSFLHQHTCSVLASLQNNAAKAMLGRRKTVAWRMLILVYALANYRCFQFDMVLQLKQINLAMPSPK